MADNLWDAAAKAAAIFINPVGTISGSNTEAVDKGDLAAIISDSFTQTIVILIGIALIVVGIILFISGSKPAQQVLSVGSTVGKAVASKGKSLVK